MMRISRYASARRAWNADLKKWTALLWLTFVALAAWVLAHRLRAINFADVLSDLRAQPRSAVLSSLAFSALAYILVGIYEGLAVRITSGRRMILHPLRTAMIANPIGRAVGFAVVSAGALRYRMYSAVGLSTKQVAATIIVVAMPFALGVGWLVDVSLVLHAREASKALGASARTLVILGVIGLAKDFGWLLFVWLRRRPVYIRGQALRLPTLSQTLVQVAFGVAQLALLSAILYQFMPPELGLSWAAFVPIYGIAFIAGALSNVPAGIGVLEAAMLLMLPHVPPAKLLGAVLAYRAIFELLPLAVALLWLLIYESTHGSGAIRRRLSRPRDKRSNEPTPPD
jgi:uncharacterized membrane protein YbhN (UPF0104 family)